MQGRSLTSVSTWVSALLGLGLITAVYYVILALVSTRWTLKPILGFALFAAAIASHYISTYGIVIDTSMMRNVLETNWREASELIGLDVVLTLLPLAILPIGLLMFTRVAPRRNAAVRRGATIVIAVVTGVTAGLLVFKDLGPTVRNRPEIRNLLTPMNFVVSTARALRQRADNLSAVPTALEKVGRGVTGPTGRPVLFVFVVGETARAASFSLNGYARETNPELAKLDVINFSQTRACGTATETSLPCMFSPFGRRDYDESRIRRHESLLPQLDRAGMRVVWLENQSGCKGVCNGLEFRTFSDSKVAGICSAGRCFDEAVLEGMDSLVRESPSDLFVVFHQLGNHGPSYFRRYPQAFRVYEPVCEVDTLRGCTQQEVVNAYDNAIRYTDYVLSRLIAFLETQRNRYDVALLYVSDHGESLGERGLYLHGLPYRIAPREQIDVPMIWWLAPEFARNRNIDVDCFRARAGRQATHDNLFHSITGVLDVETPDRDASLDLFANCRQSALPRPAVVYR